MAYSNRILFGFILYFRAHVTFKSVSESVLEVYRTGKTDGRALKSQASGNSTAVQVS